MTLTGPCDPLSRTGRTQMGDSEHRENIAAYECEFFESAAGARAWSLLLVMHAITNLLTGLRVVT